MTYFPHKVNGYKESKRREGGGVGVPCFSRNPLRINDEGQAQVQRGVMIPYSQARDETGP